MIFIDLKFGINFGGLEFGGEKKRKKKKKLFLISLMSSPFELVIAP